MSTDGVAWQRSALALLLERQDQLIELLSNQAAARSRRGSHSSRGRSRGASAADSSDN